MHTFPNGISFYQKYKHPCPECELGLLCHFPMRITVTPRRPLFVWCFVVDTQKDCFINMNVFGHMKPPKFLQVF